MHMHILLKLICKIDLRLDSITAVVIPLACGGSARAWPSQKRFGAYASSQLPGPSNYGRCYGWSRAMRSMSPRFPGCSSLMALELLRVNNSSYSASSPGGNECLESSNLGEFDVVKSTVHTKLPFSLDLRNLKGMVPSDDQVMKLPEIEAVVSRYYSVLIRAVQAPFSRSTGTFGCVRGGKKRYRPAPDNCSQGRTKIPISNNRIRELQEGYSVTQRRKVWPRIVALW